MVQTGQPHLNYSASKEFLAKGVAIASADPLLSNAELRRVPLDQVKREMAQGRKVLRPMTASDPTVVFTERHIEVSSNYAAYCSIWAKKRTVSPTQIVGVPDQRSETTERDEARGRELSSCHSAVVADDAA